MRILAADVFLALFGISIAVTYFSIRLGWLRLLPAALSGWLASSTFLFFFSFLKGDSLAQALGVGIGLGLLFTATSASVGAFFYANSGVQIEAQREKLEKPHD